MLNKHYLHQDVLPDLQTVFQREGSIQLQHFLEDEWYLKLLDRVKRLHYKQEYYPQYSSFSLAPFSEKRFLEPIHEFACKLLGASFQLRTAQAHCFQHRDYTLLHDELQEEEGISVFVELTPRWSVGYGGFTSFIHDNQEMLRILPLGNTLTMVRTYPDMKRFVKYVNHRAERQKRYFLEFKYP